MVSEVDFHKLDMIGCGSMGGGMTQPFAEHGYEVGLQDPALCATYRHWQLWSLGQDGPLGYHGHLIKIGADICSTKDEKTVGEEGTGVWSSLEGVTEHVPAPTLTEEHYIRIASSDLAQRRRIKSTFEFESAPQVIEGIDKEEFLEQLRLAVYAACLASYVEGLNVINKADISKKFNIDYTNVLLVWHAGCIIQADCVNRDVIEPICNDWRTNDSLNSLYEPSVAREFKKSFSSLRKVVLTASAADHVIPTMSATLEYLKIQTSTDLPTSFYEAELDYFGNHRFDTKGDDPSGKPEMGKHNHEWKSA